MRRPNQFDQFIELGQHEYSCRGIWSRALTCDHLHQFSELCQHEKSRRGILSRDLTRVWNRDLTCDHLPKAVVHGIRLGRGNCRYCLTQGIGSISKVSSDLINSISFLS